jgi:hypothetical protein
MTDCPSARSGVIKVKKAIHDFRNVKIPIIQVPVDKLSSTRMKQICSHCLTTLVLELLYTYPGTYQDGLVQRTANKKHHTVALRHHYASDLREQMLGLLSNKHRPGVTEGTIILAPTNAKPTIT